jgi:alkylation response protein AidB-like acyl-CoA dehydrogenase
MDIAELIDAVLDGRIGPAASPTEGDYHRLWLEQDISREGPFVAAALGGALADRLAWVFLAGYQSTIRRCFPQLPVEPGWAAFVNTEDSSGRLPGTALTGEPGQRRLNGWKHWLAAADHADRLLVSARQEHTPFLVLRRDTPGVRIETYEPATYLAELVQGLVQFVDVHIAENQVTGDERTFPTFRASETAYVRAALFAFMLSHGRRLRGSATLVAGAVAGLLEMQAILQLPLPSEAAVVALLGADDHCQLVALEFEELIEVRDQPLYERWQRDARLVHGASDRLLGRAAGILATERQPH